MRILGAGSLLGSWLIEERRGGGGFAEVFRARHIGDPRRAALKVLGTAQTASPQLVRRFEQEGELLARLAHPAIPAILDRGVATDGRPWLAMEWIDGDDLAIELARRGRLPLDQALTLLTEIADALDAAHAAGIVHRDLKPGNVLLEPTAHGPRARLIDFGIAKPLHARAALAHTADTMLGTPRHMAPEQLLGRAVDARTDVYAFGLLAFELLTGRPAFAGHDLAELEAQHLGAPPPRVSEHAPVPAALDEPLRRCLAKDPAHRPARVGDALAAIAGAATSAPAAARPEAEPEQRATLLIEAQLAADLDEPEDADLDDMEAALELARALCAEAGLRLRVSSGSTVMAVAATAEPLEAVAATLRARLAARTTATGRVELTIRLGVER